MSLTDPSSVDGDRDERRGPPPTLVVACALVVVETVAEVGYVITRDDVGAIGKAMLAALFAVKIAFAAGALQLRAGGALGVLLCESMTVLGALVADFDDAVRITMAAVALGIMALVAASFHAFPTPELPH